MDIDVLKDKAIDRTVSYLNAAGVKYRKRAFNYDNVIVFQVPNYGVLALCCIIYYDNSVVSNNIKKSLGKLKHNRNVIMFTYGLRFDYVVVRTKDNSFDLINYQGKSIIYEGRLNNIEKLNECHIEGYKMHLPYYVLKGNDESYRSLTEDIIIDCFAGGGGVSLGLEKAFGRAVNYAINHDPNAIAMHELNHPDTVHFTEDIMRINLGQYLKWGQRVRFMWASPDCTSHSVAKGNKPIERGLRILPMGVYRLCKQILKYTGYLPEVLMMENVKEIMKWGPLGENNKPIKEREGEYYRKFVRLMKDLGYEFEHRVLVAADFGAHTSRERWYGQFRCDGRPIVFPKPTHSRGGVSGLLPWEPISQDLNFNDLGSSIFTRKIPLKDKTLRRIAAGIKKFVVDDPNRFLLPDKLATPFLIQYHSETNKDGVRGQSVNEPIQTIDTSNRYGLVTCFLSKFYKTGTGQSVNEPIHTITTSAGHFGLVSAFLIKYYGNGIGQSINAPIDTIVSKDRFGLVTVVIDGVTYQIVDIWFRMLNPKELSLGQGFSKDYIINFMKPNGKPYPKSEVVERIGNSVVPIMAEKLAITACPYLKVGERVPNILFEEIVEKRKLA